jgi:hypothetical protein
LTSFPFATSLRFARLAFDLGFLADRRTVGRTIEPRDGHVVRTIPRYYRHHRFAVLRVGVVILPDASISAAARQRIVKELDDSVRFDDLPNTFVPLSLAMTFTPCSYSALGLARPDLLKTSFGRRGCRPWHGRCLRAPKAPWTKRARNTARRILRWARFLSGGAILVHSSLTMQQAQGIPAPFGSLLEWNSRVPMKRDVSSCPVRFRAVSSVRDFERSRASTVAIACNGRLLQATFPGYMGRERDAVVHRGAGESYG